MSSDVDGSTRLTATLAGLLGLLVVAVPAIAQERSASVVRGPYSQSAIVLLQDMAKATGPSLDPSALGRIDIHGDPEATMYKFLRVDSGMDILLANDYPSAQEKEALAASAVPDSAIRMLGQRRLFVIVNSANTIKSISFSQIQMLLHTEKKTEKWSDVGGSGGTVKVYSENLGSWCREFLSRKCMRFMRKHGLYIEGGFHAMRDDMELCGDADDVISHVRKNPDAIGFMTFMGKPVSGVKVLAVSAKDDGPAVEPSQDIAIQEGYPLTEPLILYVHPNASTLSKQLCDALSGPSVEEVAKRHGLITVYAQHQFEASKRLTAMKKGEGPRLSATGIGFGQMIPNLAVEYVKAKTVVQMSYADSESDAIALGMFVRPVKVPLDATPAASTRSADLPTSRPTSMPVAPITSPFVAAGGKELLVLPDKPSDQAMKVYGEKWKALGPDGNGPADFVIAGRAVGVIVSKANKQVDSVTLDQLRSIYSGEMADWKELGSPQGKIKTYGLLAGDPTGAIFYKQAIPRDKAKRMTAKKDSAEVIAEVSMDPAAIGFVDLAAVSTKDKAIKILSIGPEKTPVQATPANIANGTYPLSQRLYLYVHPKASQIAKDFAKFLTTCGGSEVTPYADTVKAVMDAYHNHGLIPLADAAIDRMAKDAAAAEAAAAAKAKAKEPTTKPVKAK
jgi:ABC-type phosphate transport system substrate-binding protein